MKHFVLQYLYNFFQANLVHLSRKKLLVIIYSYTSKSLITYYYRGFFYVYHLLHVLMNDNNMYKDTQCSNDGYNN